MCFKVDKSLVPAQRVRVRLREKQQCYLVYRDVPNTRSYTYNVFPGKHHPINTSGDVNRNLVTHKHAFRRTMTKTKKTTAAKVASEINTVLENRPSTKTVRKELYRFNIHWSVAIDKTLVNVLTARILIRFGLPTNETQSFGQINRPPTCSIWNIYLENSIQDL